MRWTIGTKIGAGFALALVILALIGISSYSSLNSLINAAKMVLKEVAEQAIGDPANGRQVEKGLVGDLISHYSAIPLRSILPPGPG